MHVNVASLAVLTAVIIPSIAAPQANPTDAVKVVNGNVKIAAVQVTRPRAHEVVSQLEADGQMKWQTDASGRKFAIFTNGEYQAAEKKVHVARGLGETTFFEEIAARNTVNVESRSLEARVDDTLYYNAPTCYNQGEWERRNTLYEKVANACNLFGTSKTGAGTVMLETIREVNWNNNGWIDVLYKQERLTDDSPVQSNKVCNMAYGHLLTENYCKGQHDDTQGGWLTYEWHGKNIVTYTVDPVVGG